MDTKRIVVRYFAELREQRGLDREVVDTTSGNPAELYRELSERHRFGLAPQALRAAVNDRFVNMTDPLEDGDSVVFVPPVNGG